MHPFARHLALAGPVVAILFAALPSRGAATNDYAAVGAIFAKHCLDCHAAQDPEGKLVLESFEALMKGGESGPSVLPGKGADSLLVKAVVTGVEHDGKRKLMPPGKRAKLTAEEIAVLQAWIDQGARPPAKTDQPIVRELVLPKIPPTVPPRRSIQAMAFSPALKLIAVARYSEVELLSSETRQVTRTLSGLKGQVSALAFSSDGKLLAAAAGEPARFGQATLWNAEDGKLIRAFEGHADALYAVAISPDGSTLATGSYDQKVKLWNLKTGELRQTLSAHHGAIYGLAFRPDGKILASASGDRTVKLWAVATGKRVETLNQPLKEQYTVAWSKDGKRLAAAGFDNRIRVWSVSESAAETTNPLLISKFAHEGAILCVRFSPDGKSLVSSADDRSVKGWDAAELAEKSVLEAQPDVAPALAFLGEGKKFVVGRLDGSVEFYDGETGKPVPPAAPGLSGLEPRGLQRGTLAKFRLTGTNLASITRIVSSSAKLSAELEPERDGSSAQVKLTAASDAPRGSVDLSVVGPGGESGKVKVFVDDLPQVFPLVTNTAVLPVSFWGVLDEPGRSDEFTFEAKAGQTLVLDLAVRSVGSKLTNGSLTLLDERGVAIASDNGFDGGDRFVAWRVAVDGRYQARIGDQMLGATKNHFYRLSVGELPMVTGVFPLSATTNAEAELTLAGFNLPAVAKVRLKTGGAGEMDVPLDLEKFRARRAFKLLVAEGVQSTEREPNDTPGEATSMQVPGAMNGRIDRPGEADLFRFEAQAGRLLIIETDAARRGSTVDTKVEVLHPDGTPVKRVLLQAVRNTANNFRPFSSDANNARLDNYEEMELNEFLYMNGDVMQLLRMPQGPDSDMLFFTSAGKRRAYFDTTATGHALDEAGFIVQPQPVDAKLVPSGLPVFALNFENDDDGERRLGIDSRIHFTAPTNGAYLARVTDTRGQGGDRFAYRLVVREARPDFSVTLSGANPTVSPVSGQSFTVTAERFDDFDGDIRVEIRGLPTGFSVSTPIVIQGGQTEAKGTIFAAMDAPQPDGTNAMATRITATATIHEKAVTKDVNSLGPIKLGAKPKLYVSLQPWNESATNHYDPAEVPPPLELLIAPGETIPAWLKIHRAGHKDLVTFFAENLPHGVIVADIGLNGVLIPKGESERQIFFNAAKWVPDQDRLFYMIEQQAGRQTSRPVLLKVRKTMPGQAASAR